MRVLAVLLVLAGVARAEAPAAQQHYAAGAALYEATRYEAALREFEAAQSIEPRVGLVYDIALCLDRLDRREEALAAYERFLDGAQGEGERHIEEARRRIAALRAAPPLFAPVLSIPAPVKPARKRSYVGPGALAGGTIALGVIGAGLLGSALSSYSSLSAACAPMCPANTWDGLPARQNAGAALLGIAGAAVVGDIVWFVIESKRK